MPCFELTRYAETDNPSPDDQKIRGFHAEAHQDFQGALPLFQRLVSNCCSLKVSMHCQKPEWRNAAICPSAANRANGCCSSTHPSPGRCAPMRLSITKIPPLINVACCSAFSLKAVTVFP